MKLKLPSIEKLLSIVGLVFYSELLTFSSLFKASDAPLTSSPLTPILQIIQHGLFISAIFFLACNWKKTLLSISKSPFLCCLLAIIISSFIWSDFPDDTLRRSIALFETTTYGIYFGSRFSLTEQLKILATVASIIMLVSLLFSIAFPGNAIETGVHAGALRGPFIQKNGLGRISVLCFIASFLNEPKNSSRKRIRLFTLLLSLLFILLSTSKTALLLFIVLMTIIYLYKTLYMFLRRRSILIVPSICLSSIAMFSLAALVSSNLESIVTSTGRDLTLSGRTTIWSAVISKIAERPILGYGYVGFWRDIYGESAYIGKIFGHVYLPKDSHNGFLELALAFGIVGVILFLLSFLKILKYSAYLPLAINSHVAYWPLVYLSFLILYNQTEATLISHNSIFWVLYVALAVSGFKNFMEVTDLQMPSYHKESQSKI